MLTEKVKNYLIEADLYDETDDTSYQKVIEELNIDASTAFADFNLNTNSATFSRQLYDIYNVCWFAINSTYFEQIEWMQSALKLPQEYIPLDSFEG
ncbi:hypothetical protein [Xylocopilactobacillus apicola]|uniref:Phage gp6-like head-tail connector protein n=1 Tax=Xylocopilactobacillus apicola TaxID=2932184 RepID=A0AAU9DD13_9LACO|nr:hypothetical protein [Xylocopilactobacillus apicola]BDR57690.1 hypothetical protein XA3_01310 [Xylocopilactobacillus apicola]